MARGWARLLEAGRRELAALARAGRDPRATQLALLGGILRRNAGSGFGLVHGFGDITGIEAYRARVPIRDYDGFAPWIDRITKGEIHALTADAPLVFEQTGGSGGGRKLIPYTAPLLESFRGPVLAWIADLVEHDPGIAEGLAYFAISPATRAPRQMAGGLPVGLASDAAYFGEALAGDASAIMLGAPALSNRADFADWRQRTLAWLAATPDLTLVSIWSPTFLTTLLDALEGQPEPVLRALHDGDFGLPAMLRRAALLQASLSGGRLETARLWPQLRMISAWADAGSARFAGHLRDRFAGVAFQPKGLLATEGVFTFPFAGLDYPLPVLTSCFLEFEGKDGEIRLVDELEEGAEYQLITTTQGGLYRYRIGDILRCRGFHAGGAGRARLPLLSFSGRASGVSDLVGEKLDEAFVAACLCDIGGFGLLVAVHEPKPHYLLLLESGRPDFGNAAQEVDRKLMENPHYADARTIGQLGALSPACVARPVETYIAWRLAQGHRLGDIKMPVMLAGLEDAIAIWPDLGQPPLIDI